MLDGVSAVVGIESDVGKYFDLQLMRKRDKLVEERFFKVGVRIPDGQPAAVFCVPNLHRNIAQRRLGIAWHIKRPVAVHYKVKLVDLIVQANIQIFDPFLIAPKLAVKAETAIAGIPGEGLGDRAGL